MSNGSPPIGTAPVPPSIAGIPQPVIVSGGQSLPPSFPLGTAGTWLPPPLVGEGGNSPFPTPVVPAAPVPPSVAGIPQPVFIPPGSPTVPAVLFPLFTTTPPSPPIVVPNIFQIGAVPPPLPSTPGQNPPPIVISAVPTIPQMPWNPPSTRPPTPLPPVNTGAPTVTIISGDGNVGSLIANNSPGTWNPAATSYTRQWQSGGTNIPGATAVSYTVQASDVGNLILCAVTATNSDGQATAISNTVGPITGAEEEEPPDPDPPPAAAARHASPSRHTPNKKR
jgi:hypothetical protein